MPEVLTYIYIFSSLIAGLTGLLVYSQSGATPGKKSFFVFTLFQVLWILALFFGYLFIFSTPPDLPKSETFVQLAYGTGLLVVMFLNAFLYSFPRKSIQFNRLLRHGYIGLTLFFAFIASFTDLVHDKQILENGVYVSDSFGVLYSAYSILLLLSLFFSVYIATKKLFGLSGLDRRKLTLAAFGCWLFVMTTISTNVILPIFGIYQLGSISLVQISPIYSLFFSVPTLYSFYRYRFFNLSYVSLNITRKFIFYTLFLALIYLFYEIGIKFFPQANLSVLIAVGIIITATILERLNRVVPAFVSESLKEYQRITQELNTQFYSSEGLTELQGDLEKAFLIQLNYINAKLYVVHSGEDKLPILTQSRDAFADELQKYKKEPLLLEEIPFTVKSEGAKDLLIKGMKKLHADFVLPLFSENNLIGFLALRKKEDDGSFAKEEIIEIQSMKRGLEIALMNALLKLNLEEENDLMKNIIKEKTTQLKSKIKQIEELLKQQSDFIAVTAHEFRTPLSIAMFQLEETMHSRNCPPALKKEAKVVEESLGDLKTLTEKLFAVQQFDLKKVELKLEKTDLIPLIEKAYADFS